MVWVHEGELHLSLGREDHACLGASLGHQTGEIGDKTWGLCKTLFNLGSEAFPCCRRSSSAS